ncbi:MAG: hypothetical protein ACOC3Z_02625 [Nanoarchaeota archaeon]
MKFVKQEDLEIVYDKYLTLDSIDDKKTEVVLKICDELIDASFYLKKEDGIKKAISFLKNLEQKTLIDQQNGNYLF